MAPRAFATALAGWTARWWLVAIAASVWAAPALVALARTVWPTEQGSQGPIVLATGSWLLARELAGHRGEARAGGTGWTLAWLALAICLYVPATMLNALTLQCLATYGGLVALLHGQVGRRAVARLWFPLLYLAFVIPPPFFVMSAATQALKLWIAAHAVDLVSMLGVEAASRGDALFVDQYELVVEAACSGMNSLLALVAVGLLYVRLRHRHHLARALLLLVLVLPVAVATNLARVVLLLLLVHGDGAAVLASPLHLATGVVMVVVALAMLLAIDTALPSPRRGAAPGGRLVPA